MYPIGVHSGVQSGVHPKEGVLTTSYYNQPPQSPHFEVFKFSNQKADMANVLVIQRYNGWTFNEIIRCHQKLVSELLTIYQHENLEILKS